MPPKRITDAMIATAVSAVSSAYDVAGQEALCRRERCGHPRTPIAQLSLIRLSTRR
jgi:hypothetical protein